MPIPVTSSMCLARPPGEPVPKCLALRSIAEQETYLGAKPPLADLRDVWLPWTYALLNPETKTRPDWQSWSEVSVRQQCAILLAGLRKLVEARPDDVVAEAREIMREALKKIAALGVDVIVLEDEREYSLEPGDLGFRESEHEEASAQEASA